MITIDVYKFKEQWQKTFQIAYDAPMYDLRFTIDAENAEEAIQKLAEAMDVRIEIKQTINQCGAV